MGLGGDGGAGWGPRVPEESPSPWSLGAEGAPLRRTAGAALGWALGVRSEAPEGPTTPAPELAAPAAPAAQGPALNFSLLRRPGLGRYGSVPRDRPCEVPRKTEALDAKSTHSFIIDR